MRHRSVFDSLAFAMAIIPVAVAADDVGEVEVLLPEPAGFHSSAATRLRSSNVGVDPDTVWIGHIADPAWRPRDRNGNPMSAVSFPTIATGGYGPYHIGRGDNRPGIGPGSSYNGVWDWDHLQPGEADSLMGWWPIARPYPGASARPDTERPFFGLDYGNLGNYVINQGLKRTFGVTGYWHRDVGRNSQPLPDTGSVVPGPNAEWKPISGNASAWCGLRANGDMTHVDPITGNPYNQSVLNRHGNNLDVAGSFGSFSALGTDANYPGYGSQWDQMLYQDLVLTSNADLHVSFAYATRMSRAAPVAVRVGYFYNDPTRPVTTNDGNFISATHAAATLQSPVDSFMVYLGLPVADGSCRYANGSIRTVHDRQRRWFSEVLRLDLSGGLGNIQQLLSAAGENGTMAVDGTITPVVADLTVPGTVLSTKLGLGPAGGTVRLVFRVKTNRTFDDEDYGQAEVFTSQTRGAAIIDNVSASQGGSNLVDFGDFEAVGSIDNALATPATAAWKSTGKPPGIYPHVHTVDPTVLGAAVWNDPCSPPTLTDPNSQYRNCDMLGNVLSGGDHDNAEKPGGVFEAPDQDRCHWISSPTINLMSSGPGDYNAMGIDREIAQTTDIVVSYDIHTAGFRGAANGNYFAWGLQSYPAQQPNGLKVWGEVCQRAGVFSFLNNSCERLTASLQSNALLLTSNANGIPDSIRIYFQFLSRCFNLQLTAPTCSPSSGPFVGSYIDNLSLGLVRAAPPPGLVTSTAGLSKFVDTFPSTSTTDFLSSSFDTCAAWVQSAWTLPPHTAEPVVLGDTVAILATDKEPGTRVDLVFRILPGVGNYVTIGNRASGLRRVPTSTQPAVANASSTNFWESYMGYNGEFGTVYPGGSHSMPGGTWDPNGWCSAHMDTAEWRLFPVESFHPNASLLTFGTWISSYHEQDPKYVTLGIAKNRCFIVDPSEGRGRGCSSTTTTSVDLCNLICGPHPVSNFVFPPLWTQDLNSGLALTENGLPRGQTYEFTKIIPDGQLTPGAHVQYFYRREPGAFVAVDLLPDTNFVFNPRADAARWFHFSVLPDRWKDPNFSPGSVGMARLLVDDRADERLAEFHWVSAADSIGLTTSPKRGAHNGWRARGDQGVPLQGNIGGDDSIARRDNGGQAGTVWDLWNGSGLANRAAAQPAPGTLLEGRAARNGPTGDMLRHFYRNLVMLIPPSIALASRDLLLLNDFANGPSDPTGPPMPRTIYVIGEGFGEALTDPLRNPPPDGAAFLANYFGAELRSSSYRTFSGNPRPVVRYAPGPGTAIDTAGAGFGLAGMKFGLASDCGIEDDVLQVNTVVPTATAHMFYENVGSAGPYVGAILAKNVPGTRNQITYLDGTRINAIGSIINYDPLGEPSQPLSKVGLRAYLYKSLGISVSLESRPYGPPVGVGDSPGDPAGSVFVNFLDLRSSNPMHSGEARIVFSLAATERAEVRVYDVTGRLVRTLARRIFAGGQKHMLIWDGATDSGERVRSGIYFYQLRTPTWTSQKKLTVLAN